MEVPYIIEWQNPRVSTTPTWTSFRTISAIYTCIPVKGHVSQNATSHSRTWGNGQRGLTRAKRRYESRCKADLLAKQLGP